MNNTFFVICVSQELKPEFEFRKVYKAESDAKGEEAGYIRVFNEFEEDYLYPRRLFKTVKLSQEAVDALAIVAGTTLPAMAR